MIVAAALEAPAIVAGLNDIAMVGQAIQQSGGHLGITKDCRPFAEGKIGGDDNRGALVKPTDQVEEELPTGLGEGQIAEFIQDDEVHAGQVIGQATLAGVARFDLEPIHEIDDVVEAATGSPSDAASGDRDGEVSLACAGATDQDGITLLS